MTQNDHLERITEIEASLERQSELWSDSTKRCMRAIVERHQRLIRQMDADICFANTILASYLDGEDWTPECNDVMIALGVWREGYA